MEGKWEFCISPANTLAFEKIFMCKSSLKDSRSVIGKKPISEHGSSGSEPRRILGCILLIPCNSP